MRLTLTMIAIFLCSATILWAAEKQVVIDVATMVCGPDPHNIKNTLAAHSGVSEVKISLADKTATVKFDDQKSTVDQMLSAMAGAGYASLIKQQ
jgi:periplasmic mercuric ion binding protein